LTIEHILLYLIKIINFKISKRGKVIFAEYFKRAGEGVSPVGKAVMKDIPERFA